MKDKKNKKYTVCLTMIYNGSVEVEAASESEAVEYVADNLDTLATDDIFSFGEKTADFATLIEQ